MTMKKNVLFILSACLMISVLSTNAQVKPSSDNLKHQWDFENGDADDRVGNADGILHRDANIGSGILYLQGEEAQAGYVELPADIIQINTYPELTVEIWATANEVPLNNPNMLIYFGTTEGDLGFDYFFYTPGRRFDGDPGTRVGVSIGTWNAEDGINYTSLDDEELHHHVVTWKDSLVVLYVDADSVGSAALDSADAENWYSIGTTLSNDSAFIGKGGYLADPTWKGTVELVALFDKAMTPEEVQWLYEQGEKREPIVNAIHNPANQQPMQIYSADNRLFIKNDAEYPQKLSVSVYSITGTVLWQTDHFRNGTNLYLKPGLYLVEAVDADTRMIQKILIR